MSRIVSFNILKSDGLISVHASVRIGDGQGLSGNQTVVPVRDGFTVVIQDLVAVGVQIVSVGIHPLALAQRIIGRHIGPAGDSGPLWRLKAQHRIVPGDALAHLPALCGVFVLVVDRRHVIGDAVTGHQVLHVRQIPGRILHAVRIGLSIVVAVVVHSQRPVVKGIPVLRQRRQIRNLDNLSGVGRGGQIVLVGQPVHRQVDLGRAVYKAQLLIVVNIPVTVIVDDAVHARHVQAQTDAVGDNLGQHQRVRIDGGPAVQIPFLLPAGIVRLSRRIFAIGKYTLEQELRRIFRKPIRCRLPLRNTFPDTGQRGVALLVGPEEAHQVLVVVDAPRRAHL